MKISINQTVETEMNILVIGTGVVGGLIGARLVERGADVTFLVTPRRKVQLVTQGLQLRSHFGRFRKPVTAITAGEIAGPVDLAIVAVRAQDFEQAMEAARPAIVPSTIVMPIVEGVRHLGCCGLGSVPRVVGAVMEARATVDADGILTQFRPAANLVIGPTDPADHALVTDIAKQLVGRGINVTVAERIRAKSWARFSFMASAVATTVLMGRPLRDAFRFAHGTSTFASALKESYRVGVAAGFEPDRLAVRAYEKAFLLEGRPVTPPALISDGGRAGDESAYLLAEMNAISRRANVDTILLDMAWKRVTNSADVTLAAEEISEVV
jgi:2-dehydropantoate 2-reductase